MTFRKVLGKINDDINSLLLFESKNEKDRRRVLRILYDKSFEDDYYKGITRPPDSFHTPYFEDQYGKPLVEDFPDLKKAL